MRSRHYKAKHERICRYCGEEFMAKQPSVDVCYSPPCQRMKDRDSTRRKYLRLKQREAASQG
jgi:hypothetical protein